MAKLYINEKNQKGHINAEIYGNFSEHLGRCIYEGLYVEKILRYRTQTVCETMSLRRFAR